MDCPPATASDMHIGVAAGSKVEFGSYSSAQTQHQAPSLVLRSTHLRSCSRLE